jgi:hypothetical protein
MKLLSHIQNIDPSTILAPRGDQGGIFQQLVDMCENIDFSRFLFRHILDIELSYEEIDVPGVSFCRY